MPSGTVHRVCKHPESTCYSWTVGQAIPAPSANIWGDPAMHAFRKFTEQFPSDVSLGNFLIELREGVKSMLPRLGHLWKIWSSGLLSWEFGLKPFLDDCRKLLLAWNKAIKRLRFLRDHNHKRTVVHYTESSPWDWKSTLIPEDSFINGGVASEIFGNAICRPSNWHGKFTAGAVILPELVGLDDAIASLIALAATLGLNNPIKILWNAIPWSWLLQWFINLDRTLDDMAIQVFPGTIRVLDLWHSITVSVDLDVYHASRSVGSPNIVRTKTGAYKYVRYDRCDFMPLPPQSEWLKFNLSVKQLAILAALANEHLLH